MKKDDENNSSAQDKVLQKECLQVSSLCVMLL